MKPLKKKFQYGKHEVIIETGQIARQSDGAVLVNIEGTVVLTTVVAKNDGQNRDFFPLTVNYQEKTYAAGKIPGGFFKREGRPAEKETLISRLIDRPIRPLFPKEFTHEVQVICTVMSLNTEVDADIPSLIGASAALKIAGVPFQGPLGAARIGYKDGSYILNPSKTELFTSELDLMVAGTKDGVLMVESEAKMLSEEVMLGAVSFGHSEMQSLINEIDIFAKEFGVKDYGWVKPENENEALSLMNDSSYGLTASIWTNDKSFAENFGKNVETGTFFMNRCDYLDPGLAWTGVKDTGIGVTLSVLGFDHLTRAKSYHIRNI